MVVRWGVMGTAGIARRNFLPAVREAGGHSADVAGRDAERTAKWARDNGIGRAVVGYQSLVDDPGLDALYIPLPNALHAEWTIRALRAGKPVLCEKPLAGTLAEAEQVLAVARETGVPLWEAFVFPFHDQMNRVTALLAAGVIGELLEIQSCFHFAMTHPESNIRMSAALAGGALNDVGCYPVRLARDLFGAEHTSAWASAVYDPEVLGRAIGGLLRMPEPVDVRHIASPKVSVAERLAHLRELLRRGSFTFDEAVARADRVTVAVTLFAVLELYKQGELNWRQDEPFGEITIEAPHQVAGRLSA